MNRIRAALLLTMVSALPLQAISAEAESSQRPTAPASPEINALPPVGKGLNMVKPYEPEMPEPDRVWNGKRGSRPGYQVPVPLSRETVPPAYRYGSPGYTPDGRGGRGYDYGYPGYRDSGGGGYPHHRSYGTGRPVR